MLFTDGDETGEGSFNGAVGAFALNANETGFSNNAMGDLALFKNISGAQNTAIGDLALEVNDTTGAGPASSTRQLALWRSCLTLLVVEHAVGDRRQERMMDTGFNNTYVGQFVGTRCRRRRQYDPHRRPLTETGPGL